MGEDCKSSEGRKGDGGGGVWGGGRRGALKGSFQRKKIKKKRKEDLVHSELVAEDQPSVKSCTCQPQMCPVHVAAGSIRGIPGY